MQTTKISCASCGAPINISSDAENITCAHCGTALVVQRGEGYIALKLGEQISNTIHEVGVQTQSSIHESTQVTQAELKRVQLSQELSTVNLQLSNVQAEIRALERQRANSKTRKQVKELRNQEMSLMDRAGQLQAYLAPLGSMSGETVSSKKKTTALVLCLLFGYFGLHRFYTGHIVIGIIQLLTFGGFLLWWLLDLLLIIMNNYKDANGKPLG